MNQKARSLRKNMTEAEKRLWSILRNKQLDALKFRRQHPIARYVVDFACFECRLVVEVDGGQHAASAADEVRTAKLRESGWTVVRFWNNEILENIDGVAERILEAARAARPHPPR